MLGGLLPFISSEAILIVGVALIIAALTMYMTLGRMVPFESLSIFGIPLLWCFIIGGVSVVSSITLLTINRNSVCDAYTKADMNDMNGMNGMND